LKLTYKIWHVAADIKRKTHRIPVLARSFYSTLEVVQAYKGEKKIFFFIFILSLFFFFF